MFDVSIWKYGRWLRHTHLRRGFSQEHVRLTCSNKCAHIRTMTEYEIGSLLRSVIHDA